MELKTFIAKQMADHNSYANSFKKASEFSNEYYHPKTGRRIGYNERSALIEFDSQKRSKEILKAAGLINTLIVKQINASSKRILNVKQITKKEIEEKWNIPFPICWDQTLFIRCNSKGVVNWDKAPIFTALKLVKRGTYVIH